MKIDGKKVRLERKPIDSEHVCKICVFYNCACAQSGIICTDEDFKDQEFDHYFVSDEKDN